MTYGRHMTVNAMETQQVSGRKREFQETELNLEEGVFDKSKFDVVLNVLALRVPMQQCSRVSKILSGYVFDRPRVKHIIPDPSDSSTRLVILSEHITDPSLSELPDDKLASLRSVSDINIVQHHVLLDYSYWTADHILKDLLPSGSEVPSSFETVGHIAHLNIRDELIPYKKLIATVILDKNQPKIKTIVNKVGTITNQFRVPTFEVLAGDPSLVTEVKQHGATFRLDYGLVYWNSRLEYEHKRLISQFRPQQVVCDMFAGVGPFAIPAAQKGCIVFANDLNPDSVKYLQINADINKVNTRIHTFNMDARDFMRQLLCCQATGVSEQGKPKNFVPESCLAEEINLCQRGSTSPSNSPLSDMAVALPMEKEKEELIGTRGRRLLELPTGTTDVKPWEHVDHVIMNLPASALTFLDVFQGILSRTKWKGTMPRLHCYCFVRSNDTIEGVIKNAEKVIGGPIKQPRVWEVRDVAPNKTMICLSFDLPEVVGFSESMSADCTKHESSTVPCVGIPMKKPRMGS